MEDIKGNDSIHTCTNDVFPLLYASKKYLLNEISEECKQYIENNTCDKTSLDFLRKSTSYGLTSITQDLKEKLNDRIHIGIPCNDLLNSETFLSLPINIVLEYFVTNDNCNVKEEILFERCVEYCKVNTAKMVSVANMSKNF